MDGDYCKCGDETCEKDKLCASDGKCSKEVSPVEYIFCTNDNNFHGQLQECNGSECTTKPCLDEETGNPVSCNGNVCGKCLDYVSSCENNEEGNGVVYMCQGGQKQPLYTCSEGVSCLKKDCTETGCAGETWCGECHEGEFVCKNGNVPENTRLETNDGFIDVPVGTIIGMRSKCIDGKWKQLALDDRENCYYGYLNSAESDKYPQITVNGKQIVTVWSYNSNGLVSDRYSLAACAEDGVNCGECSYSFSYCSNQKYYTCNNGKVLELTCEYSDSNGNTGCYSGNSCYKASTAGYCKGTSCQNCKSICNW